MFGINLNSLPLKAKWLVTFVLFSFILNHLSSALLVWEVTTQVDANAKEHFAFKTFALLLRMAHQHTFGHGTMYFVTGGIFLFADVAEGLTIALIAAAFIGAWLDLASWFLLKYGSAKWEWLSMACGLSYFGAFLAMAGTSLLQLWRPRNPDR